MRRSGYACVRHVFCTLNAILWLSGCGMIGLGIWLKLSYSEYTTLLPQYEFFGLDTLAAAIGSIMFFIALMGCCGSWFENRCMLITYFSLVIFMFLVEFSCAVLAFTFRKNLGYTFQEELKYGIETYYTKSNENSIHLLWDKIQREFKCCGVYDYEDWYDIQAWKGKERVPDSCCQPQYQNITRCGSRKNPSYWYENGCSEQVQMWFVERLHIVGAIGLFVTFIQLFGLLSSLLLSCTSKYKRVSSTYRSYET